MIRTPTFFTVDVEAYRPGGTSPAFDVGHGSRPRGALTRVADPLAGSAFLRGSDLGWRSRSTDPGGVVAYPPVVVEAFQVSRRLNLDPTQSSVGAAASRIRFSAAGGRFDAIATDWNSDRRPVTVRYGTKGFDATRGYFTDPAAATLQPAFVGVAKSWLLTETELQVPVRDASYFLERPLPRSSYGGTGGLDGTPELTGKWKPYGRGGSLSAPLPNVPAVLVDPVENIWQFNDGPGQVVEVREGGVPFIDAGDVPDLYAGTPPSTGEYRTCNALGLFQLAAAPAFPITVDCVCHFPTAGAVSQASQVALYVIAEDGGVPWQFLNGTSFALDLAPPVFERGYGSRPHGALTRAVATLPDTDPASGPAGVWYGPDEQPSIVDVVDFLVTGFGGQVVPNRAGQLTLLILRDIPAGTQPAAYWTRDNVQSLTAEELTGAIAPIVYRVRVGYSFNRTVMDANALSPSVTDAQRQFAAGQGPFATWFDSDVIAAWAQPGELQLRTALLQLADAQKAADRYGAIWGRQRRLFTATVSLADGLRRDIGDVVQIVWQSGGMRGGVLARIVGESWRSSDNTISFPVLV